MLTISLAWSRVFVNKMSAKPQPKKMGRPPKPGGHDVLVAGRVPTATAAAVDAFAKRSEITRSEAVRQLIEAGLLATGKCRRAS